eukprot:8197444-Lingulodinium_polyedra.AAC.1
MLLQGLLAVVATRAPMVKTVQRAVGELNFVQQFRPATRSLLDHTYVWMAEMERTRRRRCFSPAL